MMDFNEPALKGSLDRLPEAGQLAFMLLLCERMMPGLSKFANDTGFDASRYRKCLDDAWSYLSGQPLRSEPGKLAEACLDGAPDTEEFDHPLTSVALSAALATAALMRFLSERNVDHAVAAATLAFDTATLYAEDLAPNRPLSSSHDETIRQPLVQQELQRQAEDLKFLLSLPAAAPGAMAHLIRQRATRALSLLTAENK
jgi:uncharacterized protein YjaG (DUF416 family)